MNRIRLIAVVLLGEAILVSCIPSENRGFSLYLLLGALPATELSTVELDDL